MTAHTQAILFLLEEHRRESVNPHATSACVRHKEAVEAEVKAMEPPPVREFSPTAEEKKEEPPSIAQVPQTGEDVLKSAVESPIKVKR